MKKTLSLTFAFLLACFCDASAQVLTGFQLNFNTSDSSYSGEGALGETIVPLSIGNGVPNPLTQYSLGDGVSMSFTTGGGPVNGTSDNSFADSIYWGYAFDTEANDVITFTLSGLTAGDTYTLAGYAGEGSAVTFAASTSGTLTGENANPSDYVLGENYTTFIGEANSLGDLTVTAAPTEGNIDRLSGIGIESVPEPSAFSLLAAGGVALLILGRGVLSKIG